VASKYLVIKRICKYFTIYIWQMHSNLNMSSTLVAPRGWLRFAAETWRSSQTNCVIIWEYLRIKKSNTPIFLFGVCNVWVRISRLIRVAFCTSSNVPAHAEVAISSWVKSGEWARNRSVLAQPQDKRINLSAYWRRLQPMQNRQKTELNTERQKGKANPLQAWTGPEGSRRLRLPEFKTICTWRW